LLENYFSFKHFLKYFNKKYFIYYFHVTSKQFTRKNITNLTHPEPKSICINEIVTNVYTPSTFQTKQRMNYKHFLFVKKSKCLYIYITVSIMSDIIINCQIIKVILKYTFLNWICSFHVIFVRKATCCCVFKVITLAWVNQGNYFENANACSKRTLKATDCLNAA